MDDKFDPLVLVNKSDRLAAKTKKTIATKMKNVAEGVALVEDITKLDYPKTFVEPVLSVATSADNVGGLGVLYARTMPIESGRGQVDIVVALSAPLVMFGSKPTVRLVLAHEFLHYLELARNFLRMDIASSITSNSLYEEQHTDNSRALDPGKVFGKNKKLVSDLRKRTRAGLADEKLNERCRKNWIEKGLPVKALPVGYNQTEVSVGSILSTNFDEKLKRYVSELHLND